MRGLVVIVAVGVAWTSVAAADIFEWRDADGVRHFTTDAAAVPAAFARSLRTVARARAAAPASPASVDVVASPAPPRMVHTVVGGPPPRPAPAPPAVDTGPVFALHGPLAVAVAEAQAPLTVLEADPWWWHGPVDVTQSFDRGASRHRTRRMQLQHRFQHERAHLLGPYRVR